MALQPHAAFQIGRGLVNQQMYAEELLRDTRLIAEEVADRQGSSSTSSTQGGGASRDAFFDKWAVNQFTRRGSNAGSLQDMVLGDRKAAGPGQTGGAPA